MSTHCDRHDCPETFPDGCPTCNALLERARVVGVLDAHSERIGQQWRVFANVAGPPISLPYHCEIGGKTFGGDSSYDAARAAAAKAIEAGEV